MTELWHQEESRVLEILRPRLGEACAAAVVYEAMIEFDADGQKLTSRVLRTNQALGFRVRLTWQNDSQEVRTDSMSVEDVLKLIGRREGGQDVRVSNLHGLADSKPIVWQGMAGVRIPGIASFGFYAWDIRGAPAGLQAISAAGKQAVAKQLRPHPSAVWEREVFRRARSALPTHDRLNIEAEASFLYLAAGPDDQAIPASGIVTWGPRSNEDPVPRWSLSDEGRRGTRLASAVARELDSHLFGVKIDSIRNTSKKVHLDKHPEPGAEEDTEPLDISAQDLSHDQAVLTGKIDLEVEVEYKSQLEPLEQLPYWKEFVAYSQGRISVADLASADGVKPVTIYKRFKQLRHKAKEILEQHSEEFFPLGDLLNSRKTAN